MYAVIMAGGSGTRFWPASRGRRPKQFLKITGERTMLEETIARIAPLVDQKDIAVVVGAHHVPTTRSLVGGTPIEVVVEPVGRNTAPCVGLAALYANRRDPDDAMVVLPADHFVANEDEFRATISAAAEVARDGAIVTLGILPTRPETGYGYVEVAETVGTAAEREVHAVARFVEKPDAETALDYLRSGRFRWNSGIFAFTPRTILGEIERCLPALHAGLEQIAAALGTPDEPRVVDEVYREIEPISIDHGVMEHATTPIRMLDASFGWSDVGSWEALYELRDSERTGEGNLVVGDAVTIDSRENLVYSAGGRVVALLGVDGLVVADTPDAVLVADKRRSQDVKRIQEQLEKSGRGDLC